VVSDGSTGDEITSEPVHWSTGQSPAAADAVLWAIGRAQPNTGWLPPELLDEHGYVRVTSELKVPGQQGVYAVGDVAATDSLRSSARNRGDALVAHNILAEFAGRRMRTYKSPGGGGAHWWVHRPTDWKSSYPPARRSAYRPGRSSGWSCRGLCAGACIAVCAKTARLRRRKSS